MTAPGTDEESAKVPRPPARPLAQVAREYKQGTAGPRELFDAFVAATLYWPAPAARGIPVLHIEGKPVAPIFSSRAELARVVGCKGWFSTGGLHLLSLLPPGITIGLDMGSPHRLQLDPSAVRLEYGLVLSRQEPANDPLNATPGQEP